MAKNTRLRDVAAAAGVDTSVVSRVLSGDRRLSIRPETRQRVLEAIAQLGYRPHLPARALAEGRAPTIALMVSSIANPFYPEFALAVENGCASFPAREAAPSATPASVKAVTPIAQSARRASSNLNMDVSPGRALRGELYGCRAALTPREGSMAPVLGVLS